MYKIFSISCSFLGFSYEVQLFEPRHEKTYLQPSHLQRPASRETATIETRDIYYLGSEQRRC